MKYGHIMEVLFHVFYSRNIFVALLKSARLLQLVLDNFQAKAELLYDMSVLVLFETNIYFQGMLLLRKDFGKKMMSIYRNVVNETLAGMAAQLVQRLFIGLGSIDLLGHWRLLQNFTYGSTLICESFGYFRRDLTAFCRWVNLTLF